MREVLTNQFLVIPICAWAVAQIIKVFVGLVRERQLDLRYFVTSGGMPSAHAAMVSALATVVAITQGLGSVTFAIAVILAVVVMYDAAGVRQAAGKQAALLNRIIKELLEEKRSIGEMEHELWELIGHTPFQVIVGAILGILIAWLWLTISGL